MGMAEGRCTPSSFLGHAPGRVRIITEVRTVCASELFPKIPICPLQEEISSSGQPRVFTLLTPGWAAPDDGLLQLLRSMSDTMLKLGHLAKTCGERRERGHRQICG